MTDEYDELERIFALSDAEILQECRDAGEDPAKIAADMLALFEKTLDEPPRTGAKLKVVR